MRIEQLFIYGYGHIQNKQIDLEPSLSVFYGENEAGKSTILSFIETMLFGFPRRQSNELRYEPKAGGVHGGKMVLFLERGGILTIERVRGREPTESILSYDHKLITEERLSELLQGIDRSLFQDIFSARLEHLRHMEKLDEVALNRYLLGAGISGNLSLDELENKLISKQGDLFKRQGRVPIMNKQLKELQELEAVVQQSSGLKAQYEQKNIEKQAIEADLHTMTAQKESLKKQRYFYEKAKALEPMYSEKKLQQLKREELPQVEQFPEDGIARYERLQTRLLDFEGEAKNIENKIKQLQEGLPEVNVPLLEQRMAIQQQREQAESYRLKQERLLLLSEQIKHEKEAVTEVIDQLGGDWTYAKLSEAAVSYSEREKLEQLTNTLRHVKEQHAYLEKDLATTRNRVKASERKEKEREHHLLELEDRERLQAQVTDSEQGRTEQAKQFIQKMIAQLTEQIDQVGHPVSQSVLYLFLFITMVATGSLFFFQQPFIAVSVAVLFSVIIYFVRMNRQTKLKTLKELHELRDREEAELLQLENEQPTTNETEMAEAKEKLLEDDEKRNEWQLIKHFREQAHQEYASLSQRYETMEQTVTHKEKELREWMVRHDYPLFMTGDQLIRMFEQIRMAKKHVRSIAEAEKELTELQHWLTNYEKEINDLAAIFEWPATDHAPHLLLKLEAKVDDEKQKQQKITYIQAQLVEETERMDVVQAKMEQYERAIAELFQIADCQNEENFFEKGKAWLEKAQLNERITLINHQIQIQLPDEVEQEKMASMLETKTEETEALIERLSDELNELEHHEGRLFKQLAEIHVELENLEQGGDYEKKLQQFEMKRSAFQEHAKEWAIYTAALDLLKKTKEQHRKKRLPKVVKQAITYFNIITEGAYIAIHVPVEGDAFSVESAEGVRYSPQELSRGTQEQLYLSLRLALTAVYPANIRYPILLDDILVHFDFERMEAALGVLHEHARFHQILFFTCHQHIATEFRDEQVIRLSRR